MKVYGMTGGRAWHACSKVSGFWDTCFLGKKCGGGIDGHRVESQDESTTSRRENGEMNDMHKSTPI